MKRKELTKTFMMLSNWKTPFVLLVYYIHIFQRFNMVNIWEGALLFELHSTSAMCLVSYIPLATLFTICGVLGWLLVVVLFAPIRGGSLGICFVCWMLLRHCTEALVYSNHPRAAAASSYLAIIFGRIASGVPWFLRSTAEPMQHPHQCWRWCRLW